MSISENKKCELTTDYPFKNNADISDFIGRIIAFTLGRKFTPNTTPKIGTGTLSPITDDIIFGNEPPNPCKYFCGRDTELIILVGKGKEGWNCRLTESARPRIR